MTRHLRLDGRVFLHDYRYGADSDEATLNLLLSAPVVVASWINLQYFASTVDNERFGAGNKVLHNVTSVLGVVEGNGGDLRVGLPLQSVHDGTTWRHEPLRLSVCVAAPCEAIDRILAKNPQVADLVANEWIHLFALEDNGEIVGKSDGQGTGKPFSSNRSVTPIPPEKPPPIPTKWFSPSERARDRAGIRSRATLFAGPSFGWRRPSAVTGTRGGRKTEIGVRFPFRPDTPPWHRPARFSDPSLARPGSSPIVPEPMIRVRTFACLSAALCAVLVSGAEPSLPAKGPHPVSDRFEVRVGGVGVPVTAYKDVHYAQVSFAGPAEVEIRTLDGPVTTARIQPTAYGLKATVEGSTTRFTVTRPLSLVVQLDFREKLFLFLDPPSDPVPADAVNAATLGRSVMAGPTTPPSSRRRSTICPRAAPCSCRPGITAAAASG